MDRPRVSIGFGPVPPITATTTVRPVLTAWVQRRVALLRAVMVTRRPTHCPCDRPGDLARRVEGSGPTNLCKSTIITFTSGNVIINGLLAAGPTVERLPRSGSGTCLRISFTPPLPTQRSRQYRVGIFHEYSSIYMVFVFPMIRQWGELPTTGIIAPSLPHDPIHDQ